MASKIAIECPECSTKLNLPDSSKLGKKIRCPQCKEIFVAEASDDFDEDGDDDYDEEPAAPKKGKAAAGGKKGKKSGATAKGSNAGLLIGLAVAGLVVVGGGGAYFLMSGGSSPAPAAAPAPAPTTTAAPAAPQADPAPTTTAAATAIATSTQAPVAAPVSPTEKMAGLRWMPADTELVIHLKVSDLMKSPLLAGLLDNPLMSQGAQAPNSQMNFSIQSQFGVAPADIESVSFGYAKLTDEIAKVATALNAQQEAAPKGGAMISPGGGNPGMGNFPIQEFHYVAIIKSKVPIDLAKLSETHPGATKKELGGKTYFELPAAAPNVPSTNLQPFDIAWWAADPKTLIMGSKKEVLSTVEHGETVIPRKELSATNFQPQLVIAVALPNLETNPKLAAFEKDPNFVIARAMIKDLGLQGASVGISLKSGIDLQVAAITSTDEGSKKLKGLIEGQINTAKTLFEEYKKTGLPLVAELGDMLFKNLKIEDRSKNIIATTNIPSSAQDKLQQLPAVVMMMAMTGNLASGTGGPASSDNPMAWKLPGESEPVAPTEVEGLPEAMVLSAKTAWGANTPSGTSIELVIELAGGDISHICGTSVISAKSMTLEGGGSLRKSKPPGTTTTATASAPESGFRTYQDTPESTADHPPKTVRVKLAVDAPRATAKTISAFEGSFKILTSEGSKDFVIEEAPRRAKRPLVGDEFKEGDLKLRLSHSSVQPAWMTLSCGKDFFIGQVKGTPGDLLSISDIEAERPTQRLVSTEKDGKFPEEFQIAFQLHSNVKEQEIKFRFENLPVPSADTKPALTIEAKGPAMSQQQPPTSPPATTKMEGKPTFQFRNREMEEDDAKN